MSGLLPQHGEILLYDNGTDKQFVSVVFKDETFWLTQSGMAELFDCSADNISLHLKNIYADGELEQAATTEKFSVVRKEGSREVRRSIDHYDLDAIIAVGYRVNSKKCGAVVQGCDDNDDNLDVLDKLQAAFSQKYPEASPKWKTRSNYYIADFQNQNYAAEAWFTSDAVWLMTETDLPHASLPEAVKNAFKNSEYGQWSLDDVDMLVREGMEPVYVLEVEQGPREMDLYYNAEGILIKVVEDSEDDSEDYLPIELPEEVKNFLQEKYAASKIVETDQEHGQFEVDIIHDGVAKEVLFDNSGNWLSSSWEISLDTLPEVVKTAIRQEINDKYVGYETDDEPELVETPDGNYYRIELEAEDDREVILKIREDGSLLQ